MFGANPSARLRDIAMRIKAMREILGCSIQKMAEQTDWTEALCRRRGWHYHPGDGSRVPRQAVK